jgi:hypothetical protein
VIRNKPEKVEPEQEHYYKKYPTFIPIIENVRVNMIKRRTEFGMELIELDTLFLESDKSRKA